MRNKLFLAVAFLGLGSSLASCRRPLSGVTGSSTPNGLLPDVYHTHKNTLKDLMNLPLPSPLSGEWETVLLADPKAELLVEYVIDCAISGDVFSPSKSRTFTGRGLLTTQTAGWPSAPLDTEAQQRLHACIAARLNPKGATVDIWLGGQDVLDDGTKGSFPIPEAFWRTELTPDGPKIYYWPASTSIDDCLNAHPDAANTRVCGAPTSTCGLERRNSGECNGTTFECLDPGGSGTMKPAIGTQLTCEAWCSLYPSCAPPPGRCSAPCPQ